MSYLLTLLLLWGYQEINNQTSQVSDKVEFIDTYPVKVDGNASFFTFDSTSLTKGKFIFVVSGSKTAFFKKGGKLVIVSFLKREVKQNGYIDHFYDSGYQVTLDVNRGEKISEWSTEYSGQLKLVQKNKVMTIAVHGVNEEFGLNR
ncbi:hypothetical protein [Dyadobacter aurulentus]|uniref:hypothetical protein n=1 Tax=Dyadobacter sp. UC 10 TaxID=2605428 RepID=UPI0011F3EA9F|nr:hypothetical protein [Dyadobacter sp. UC 10]KAA0991963.1 hypothetical protein FXO21_18165 [Dyadobacter sp. UC 10]